MKGCIYRHWHIDKHGKEKSYVGRCITLNVKNRWGYKGKGYKPKKGKPYTSFWSAMQEYGWDNFYHDIIEIIEAETKDELNKALNKREKYYIELYDSYNNGYNDTRGGEGVVGYKNTPEVRANHSKVIIEKWKDENSYYNSKEYRQNLARAQKERYDNPEERIKTGEKTMECWKNEEYRKKQHESRSGEWSEERKKNFKEKVSGEKHPASKKVICLTTGEVFMTITDAANSCGKSRASITRAIKLKRGCGTNPITNEKLKWDFYTEECYNDDEEE